MSVRKYKKDEPSLEVLQPQMHAALADDTTESYTHEGNAQYQKKDSFEIPKAFIVVLSGGTIREKNYFKYLTKNPHMFPDLRFEFFAEDRFGPSMRPLVFDLAEEKVKQYQSSASQERPDEYYVVSDVDEFKSHLVCFQQKCQDLNINLIISNPCIEVWLYYSKKTDRFEEFPFPQIPQKISQNVKTFVDNKIPGGVNPSKALYALRTNTDNAKKNYFEDPAGFPTIFSTNMFKLGEKILPYVEEGLNKLQEKNQEKKIRMTRV